MTTEIGAGRAENTPADATARRHARRIATLIDRLPNRIQPAIRWLRRPASWWVRIPAGALLVIGGILSILPFLGLWMLPFGLILLAEDFPALRRMRDRFLDWIERGRPLRFAVGEAPDTSPISIAMAIRPLRAETERGKRRWIG